MYRNMKCIMKCVIWTEESYQKASYAQRYLPEAADDADAQLDEMKKELAASVAEKPEHGAEKRGEEPAAGADPENDDFEVFDLDDDL